MGFSSHAVNVIRNNRALLQKRTSHKEVKEMYLDTATTTKLEFKKVSPEKLAQIKVEIRRKAKEDAWKETGIYIGCILVVLYGLYWIIYI